MLICDPSCKSSLQNLCLVNAHGVPLPMPSQLDLSFIRGRTSLTCCWIRVILLACRTRKLFPVSLAGMSWEDPDVSGMAPWLIPSSNGRASNTYCLPRCIDWNTNNATAHFCDECSQGIWRASFKFPTNMWSNDLYKEYTSLLSS